MCRHILKAGSREGEECFHGSPRLESLLGVVEINSKGDEVALWVQQGEAGKG